MSCSFEPYIDKLVGGVGSIYNFQICNGAQAPAFESHSGAAVLATSRRGKRVGPLLLRCGAASRRRRRSLGHSPFFACEVPSANLGVPFLRLPGAGVWAVWPKGNAFFLLRRQPYMDVVASPISPSTSSAEESPAACLILLVADKVHSSDFLKMF